MAKDPINSTVLCPSSIYLLVFVLLHLCGCAVTGPEIPREELRVVEEEIEELTAQKYVEDTVRVWKIAFKIYRTLPQESPVHRKPAIGALVVDNSEKIAKAFKLPTDKGRVILGIAEDSPAARAGLRPGDLVEKLGGLEDKLGEGGKEGIEMSLEANAPAEATVKRAGEQRTFSLVPEELPSIRIRIKETEKINAYAKFTGIEVTYGLLRFVENDDELAVIIGHEVAHLIRKHLPKNMGIAALCGAVGGLTGPFAGVVTQALYAPYSRETEREADYFGLVFAHRAGYDIEKATGLWKRFALEVPKTTSKSFLRTHPASPERIVRVKKLVEIIKAGADPFESLSKNN